MSRRLAFAIALVLIFIIGLGVGFMIRNTGYGNLAFWFLFPFLGTLSAMALWFAIWSIVEWKMPESKKVKAAKEEDRHTILLLKEKLADALVELVTLQKSEAKLRMVAEMARSSNRAVNAQASEALK